MCEMREKLFDFIVAYKVEHDGNSPTYREMMAATGLTSTSMVAWHLEKLEAEGLIERPQQVGNSRVIEVVGGEWNPPPDALTPTLSQRERGKDCGGL